MDHSTATVQLEGSYFEGKREIISVHNQRESIHLFFIKGKPAKSQKVIPQSLVEIFELHKGVKR